jgi:hypothetical protein
MNPEQRKQWAAIRSRLRRGQPIEDALRDCYDAGVPVVAVVRHHLGRPGDPKFNTTEDVSALYSVHAPHSDKGGHANHETRAPNGTS